MFPKTLELMEVSSLIRIVDEEVELFSETWKSNENFYIDCAVKRSYNNNHNVILLYITHWREPFSTPQERENNVFLQSVYSTKL